jgi:hypothetical protein
MSGDGKKSASASERSKAQRKYNGTDKQKKNRAKRNQARREAVKDGRVSKGDGKDVGHKKSLKSGGSNAKSNTRVESVKRNRAAGGKSGSKKLKAAGGRKSKG